ncbi:hypothetical protein ACVNF4_09565 [Streptomyces sp. S6]
MGGVLKGLSRVHWSELRDAQEAPAAGIPTLLSRIAYADEPTALLAVDELGDAVCTLGFVVGEATAPAVPFLLQLAEAPQVPCKAELLGLLENICRAAQWHAAASAGRAGGHRTGYQEQPGWEPAARAAVRAGRPAVERLASSLRPEEAEPAHRLLRAMAEVPPFPQL